MAGKVKGQSNTKYFARCTASIAANRAKRKAKAERIKLKHETKWVRRLQKRAPVPRGTARAAKRAEARAKQPLST